jgi:hypothetical protein
MHHANKEGSVFSLTDFSLPTIQSQIGEGLYTSCKGLGGDGTPPYQGAIGEAGFRPRIGKTGFRPRQLNLDRTLDIIADLRYYLIRRRV